MERQPGKEGIQKSILRRFSGMELNIICTTVSAEVSGSEDDCSAIIISVAVLYPWRKMETMKIPIRKPYNYICAVYAVCVFFLYLKYSGPYFRQPANGASLLLGLGVLLGAFLKRDKRLVIVGLFSLVSRYIVALIFCRRYHEPFWARHEMAN